MSEMISGPLAPMILADQGADVIKVEPPGYGEAARQIMSYRAGMAALYANCNHGKRSIGLNLKMTEGLEILYELVRDADVFVQNWRPGAAERLHVGEADLREINPDLVYASVTGFGDDGPYADRRSYDPIFQALTGYISAQTNPQIPIPDLVRNAVVDKATSHQLAQGITAALLARERGAGGQHVRVAMLDAALSFFWPDGMMRHTLVGEGVENPMTPGERFQMLATSDGQLVTWMGSAEQMRDGLRAMGRADLADHPSQRGRPMLEEANQQARAEAMNEAAGKLSTAEVYERMVAHQVPAAPILTPSEVFEDPQIVHNGAVLEGEHPVYGRYRRVRPPLQFSATPCEQTPPAALYAEHTDEILAELGRDAADRERLREMGVIPTPR
ncbi:MAG: CoA transferase [Deltaproteobacteria bacterium]|nr:CoA transferase [Deltaproteobacteria bacterium]